MQYYKCSSAILEMDLKPSTLQVYHFLAARADYKNRSCFYAVPTIAQQLSISDRSVQRGTKELEKKGLIKIKTQFKKGRQTTNLYILLDEPQLKLCTPLHTPKNGKKTFHINCHIKALNSQIKGVTLKVYTYLESISVAKRHCIVSVKEIAQHCRISITSVRKAMKILAQLKLAQLKAKTAVSKWGKTQCGKNEFVLQKFHFSSPRVTGVLRRMSPLLTNTPYINTDKENFHKVCLNIDTYKERNTIPPKEKQEKLLNLINILADDL